jgi:hypothetical protein
MRRTLGVGPDAGSASRPRLGTGQLEEDPVDDDWPEPDDDEPDEPDAEPDVPPVDGEDGADEEDPEEAPESEVDDVDAAPAAGAEAGVPDRLSVR